jgi:tripartite-type tricarboxylate transporter receptor subunit TctC
LFFSVETAFPPGGADDATARILQDPMQKALGQPIVIENVGGAGGMPGQTIRVGHPGVGSFGHLVEVLMFQELDVKVTQVPYRGAGPALVDLLAGQVDLGPISAVVATPLVNSGKLKTYALIGRKPIAGLPQLKTMSQLGYKKLDVDFWHMLLAPAGTPRPIVDKLNAALRAGLADGKLRKTFADGGMDEYPPDEETPEAASALLKREIKLWGDVIRSNHIAVQ